MKEANRITYWFVLGGILMIMSLSCVSAYAFTQAHAKNDQTLKGAGPVCDGFQLRASLDRTKVTAGESVVLRLTLQNVSKKVYTVFTTEHLGIYKFDVKNARGKELATNINNENTYYTGIIDLAPGDQLIDEYPLDKIFDYTAITGRYDITVQLNLELIPESNCQVKSNKIRLTIDKNNKNVTPQQSPSISHSDSLTMGMNGNIVRRPDLIRILIPMDNKGDNESRHMELIYIVNGLGYAHNCRFIYDWAAQDSKSTNLKTDELKKLLSIVHDLPMSDVKISKDCTVVVVEYTPFGEVTRTYDRAKLPRQMEEVFTILGGVRFEAKDQVKFIDSGI